MRSVKTAPRLRALLGVPPTVRRSLAPLAVLLAVLWAPAAAPAATDAQLRASLDRAMRAAGGGSGALVVDLFDGRTLYARAADVPRVPASNQKLYTTAAALARFGPSGRLSTRVLGDGELDADGVYRGNLYLRGGGDPTFGSRGTAALARALAEIGILRVTGTVYGDETLFDGRRGGPDSRYAFSIWIGTPLSALSYARAAVRRPARLAADRLSRELRAEGVSVRRSVGERAAPPGARELAILRSPTMAVLARATNVPSDNFLAEMLLKSLGARFGVRGTTAAGAAVTALWLREAGIAARVSDGSGLSRRNRTTPRQVVKLLDHMDGSERLGPSFRASLAVACGSGTLAGRMCRTRAAGRCRGKTGTLTGVSALSGYCDMGSGRAVAFSILMNGVGYYSARRAQDAMTAAIANYVPSSSSRAGSSMTSTPSR